MLIPAGDYELNYQHPIGAPTLIPSPAWERALDFRCRPLRSDRGDGERPPTCAVHIHGFHRRELLGILDDLQGKISDFDLYITTDSAEKKDAIEAVLAAHPLGVAAGHWRVLPPCTGPGRNIAALFLDAYESLAGYDCVLHLHTKRSVHTELAEQWRQSLTRNLLGSAQLIADIRSGFQGDDQLGLLIPQICEPMREYVNWGDNFSIAASIWQRLAPDLPLRADAPLVFPVGMMFWFRPQALLGLRKLLLQLQPLPAEPLPLDGTSLHALERLVAHGCEAAGFQWRMICGEPEPGSATAGEPPVPASLLRGLPDVYGRACGLLAQRTRAVEAELLELRARSALRPWRAQPLRGSADAVAHALARTVTRTVAKPLASPLAKTMARTLARTAARTVAQGMGSLLRRIRRPRRG